MSINSSPGWSETGGPWVLPQQGMKKLVWTATQVTGGAPFHGVLPQPPDTIGPFQNAGMAGDIPPSPAAAALRFYRDSIVIAYRTPVAARSVVSATSSLGPLDAAMLADGDYTKSQLLAPPRATDDVWIRIAFDKSTVIQGLSLALSVRRVWGSSPPWRPATTAPSGIPLRMFRRPRNCSGSS
ncbi:MAG: glycosyl hydrolase [Rhizomicrobium sp.]